MNYHTRFKVQTWNMCLLSNHKWQSPVVFPRLVKYPTNLSVISFQDTSLASPKLSVMLQVNYIDIAFCHACVTAIKMGKMKIAKDSVFIYAFPTNEIGATRSSLRSSSCGSMLPALASKARHPSSLMYGIWPDRFFLASYSPVVCTVWPQNQSVCVLRAIFKFLESITTNAL